MSRFKNFRSQKGSVTLYTLVSMIFFLTVSIGVYTNSNNKLQSQEKQINQIQESYEQERDFINIEEENKGEIKSPKIQVSSNGKILDVVNGATSSQSKTIYTYHKNVIVKLSPTVIGSVPVYSETINGTKKEVTDNEVQVSPTREGVTIYAYSKDIESGEIYDIYNAITIKLTTLENKEVYVAEGKTRENISMTGINVGTITFSENSNEEIATITDNKNLNGLKAGDTTFKATESNGGATATLTAKVTKIELSKTSAVIEEDQEIEVDVTGINYGVLTATSSDTGIVNITVEGTKIKVAGIKVGSTTITVTEGNGGAEAKLTVSVSRNIEIPTAITNLIYNGNEQQGVPEGAGYTVTNGKAINAGTYTATVSLEEGMKWADGTTEDKTIEYEIGVKEVAVTWGTNTFEYNGQAQSPTASATGVEEETINLKIEGQGTDAGDYTAIASIESVTGGQARTENYKLTNTTKEFKIIKSKTATAEAVTNLIYNGKEQTGVKGSSVTWTETTKSTNVGTYTAIATPMENYEWTEGGNDPKKVTWEIAKATIKANFKNVTMTYGDQDIPVFTIEVIEGELADCDEIDISNDNFCWTIRVNGVLNEVPKSDLEEKIKELNAGTYTIGYKGVIIRNKDTKETSINNYKVTYGGGTLTINAKDISKFTVTLNETKYKYDGTAKEPTATVKDGDTTLTLNTDYTVTYSSNINAGTATATITGKGNYTGTVEKTFTINKKPIQYESGSYRDKYDGKSHTIKLTVTEPTSGYTIYYSTTQLTSSNYTTGKTTKETSENSGIKTVYWYIHSENGNYEDVSGSNQITICPWEEIDSDGNYVYCYSNLNQALVGYNTGTETKKVAAGNTLGLLQSITDTSDATIDRNLTIDFNTFSCHRYSSTNGAKTITVNSGVTLNIVGSGHLRSCAYGGAAPASGKNLITNSGTLNIGTDNNPFTGTIRQEYTGDSYSTIYNRGTLNINSGMITSKGKGTTINGGKITINSGTVSLTNTEGGGTIYTTGELTINGGTISSSAGNAVCYARDWCSYNIRRHHNYKRWNSWRCMLPK